MRFMTSVFFLFSLLGCAKKDCQNYMGKYVRVEASPNPLTDTLTVRTDGANLFMGRNKLRKNGKLVLDQATCYCNSETGMLFTDDPLLGKYNFQLSGDTLLVKSTKYLKVK